MAKKERLWVKTWKVVVNNSGESNMSSVVGRYLSPEAAERVAQAFRDARYADPYNYRTKTTFNSAEKKVDVTTLADVAVTVEEEGFGNMMSEDSIRLAQRQGIIVRDEQGQPIALDA